MRNRFEGVGGTGGRCCVLLCVLFAPGDAGWNKQPVGNEAQTS
jgi:hypothetical protein